VGEPKFHTGSKLAWTEQVAANRDAKRIHTSVAIAIAKNINGHGEAVISQAKIGNIIGATVRTVRRAIAEMAHNGDLIIVETGRGRGRESVYRPLYKRTKMAYLNRPNLVAKSGQNWPDLKNPYKTPPASTVGSKLLGVPVDAVGHPHTVTALPLRANALAGRWQAMKDHVAEIHGSDLVHAWLTELTLDQIDGSALVFMAPTKFVARYVEGNFAEKIIAAWRHTGGAADVRDVRCGNRRILRANGSAETEPPEFREASA
jgi:DnaA N-terminal domain